MNDPKYTHKAVALEYGENAAPRVTAQAEGELALLMEMAAKRLGIPALKDEQLVEVLSELQLNEQIPESLYVSVAVVMAWAYWLTGRTP
jgi:flagellar biosynthesis protein